MVRSKEDLSERQENLERLKQQHGIEWWGGEMFSFSWSPLQTSSCKLSIMGWLWGFRRLSFFLFLFSFIPIWFLRVSWFFFLHLGYEDSTSTGWERELCSSWSWEMIQNEWWALEGKGMPLSYSQLLLVTMISLTDWPRSGAIIAQQYDRSYP